MTFQDPIFVTINGTFFPQLVVLLRLALIFKLFADSHLEGNGECKRFLVLP